MLKSMFLLPYLLVAYFVGIVSNRTTFYKHVSTTYYIDSQNGDDRAKGVTPKQAWKSFNNLNILILHPGDSIRFARGSEYSLPLILTQSGTEENPIVITDYGDIKLPAPAFTNPVFKEGNFSNCIRIKGSHIIVENLYFHHTLSYISGKYTPDKGWDTTVWEMGAIYIDKSARYCKVKNNEIEDCVVGVKSYGPFAQITNNSIHDCNRILKEWGWGPIGIWLGADNQEAAYNQIINYRAEDSRIRWGGGGTGGGADGGAFEIDDARYDKKNISIHHNYTRDCQGFLEVTWTDIKQHPNYDGFLIHHNVSDDYQQFVAIWNGKSCRIENNTIIRRKKNVNDWGVFNITQNNSYNLIRNNIIVTEKNIRIFNTGLKKENLPQNIITHNLYYAATDSINMGKEGPGPHAQFGDPMFLNYKGSKAIDFAIKRGSPAIGTGINTSYQLDFLNRPIPLEKNRDIGAFQFFN
jgi:hypothetical protein